MPNIWFSDLERKTVIELPILPENMPELSKAAKNEEFETFDNGTYNFLGNVGLVSFSIDSFLPAFANKYNWAKSQINPYSLINMWAGAMTDKKPIRVVINRNKTKDLNEELLNLMISVESMNWYELRNGDVKYVLNLKEYREVT